MNAESQCPLKSYPTFQSPFNRQCSSLYVNVEGKVQAERCHTHSAQPYIETIRGLRSVLYYTISCWEPTCTWYYCDATSTQARARSRPFVSLPSYYGLHLSQARDERCWEMIGFMVLQTFFFSEGKDKLRC